MSRPCIAALLAALMLPACSLHLGEGDDPPPPEPWSPPDGPPPPDGAVGPARYDLAFLGWIRGQYGVYLGNTDGVSLRIAEHIDLRRFVEVSPDGARLAISIDDGGQRLDVLDLADGTTRRLGLGWLEGRPSWSPDGTQLTYERRLGQELAASAVRVTLDGTVHEVLAAGSTGEGPECLGPVWSPDGSEIAYAIDGAIRARNLTTGATRIITARDGVVCQPSWSPDGSLIAFTHGVSGSAHLAVVGSRGGPARDLDELGIVVAYPRVGWSPDGRSLAYTRHDPDTSLDMLRLVTLDGGPAVTLGRGDSAAPRWSADGRSILYARSGDPSVIALWDVASGTSRDLHGDAILGVREPIWLPVPLDR
jgi:Tol biopolymer transport system component